MTMTLTTAVRASASVRAARSAPRGTARTPPASMMSGHQAGAHEEREGEDRLAAGRAAGAA